MSQVVNEISIILFIPAMLMLTIGILSHIFYKQIVGYLGEHWTKKEITGLPKSKYKIINNILISVNGSTYQIDHVIISPYGIFCVETKQYNGYIVGNKYDKKWIRYVGKNRYYYENPIRQNYGHVKALSQLLNIEETKIYNIVCIPSNAKLKIEHDGELVRNYNIVDRILSYKEVIIDDIDEMAEKIIDNNIKDRNIKKQHIQNIRRNMNNKYNECPKCGGKLIKKKGKYGYFMGCLNYPDCDYTESVKTYTK